VRAAVKGVIREAVIAACLTGIMILLFLGSWRSTLIIAVSIPLSILVRFCVMSALGETINIMTLGGLALAVGILVDDATVKSRTSTQSGRRQGSAQAILDGAAQIAVPALVSTLCICIVFLPMFFLTGVARYLFVPLAEAVVFAMLASYLLSRTLVPTLAMYLLQAARGIRNRSRNPGTSGAISARLRAGFDADARRVSRDCWPPAFAARECSFRCFWRSARPRFCCFPGWARTFSPPPTPASSICICAPKPARASRKPRAWAT
jgi:multidrug efflux pump subunit AcrB